MNALMGGLIPVIRILTRHVPRGVIVIAGVPGVLELAAGLALAVCYGDIG